jgi:hypothetical protein
LYHSEHFTPTLDNVSKLTTPGFQEQQTHEAGLRISLLRIIEIRGTKFPYLLIMVWLNGKAFDRTVIPGLLICLLWTNGYGRKRKADVNVRCESASPSLLSIGRELPVLDLNHPTAIFELMQLMVHVAFRAWAHRRGRATQFDRDDQVAHDAGEARHDETLSAQPSWQNSPGPPRDHETMRSPKILTAPGSGGAPHSISTQHKLPRPGNLNPSSWTECTTFLTGLSNNTSRYVQIREVFLPSHVGLPTKRSQVPVSCHLKPLLRFPENNRAHSIFVGLAKLYPRSS